ncbi:MAG: GNAT family N-acetyltransferase [Spirochaetaceae bacterium]|nr:GNAT family N-acetyltransferase [Spirochaetaceae bacterium]
MNLTNKEYEDKHFDKAVELISATWDFTTHFKNLEKVNIPYIFYLKHILLSCSYKRVVVDEKDNLVGFFCAEIKDRKNAKSIKLLEYQIWLNALIGNFGNRRKAMEFFKKYQKECEELYSGASFDKEVHLLAVSPLCKGKGLGKKLINDYMKKCKTKNIKKIGLQTGSDCNYKFYNHLGFDRENSLFSTLYIQGIEEDNLFIYTKEIV